MAATIKRLRVTTAFTKVLGTAIVVEHQFTSPITIDLSQDATQGLVVKMGADTVLRYAPGTWVSAIGIPEA